LAFALLAVVPAVAGDAPADKVVVTKPGVVFHKAGASDIRGRAVDKSVDAAIESGYAPCPVCFARELSVARSTDLINGGAPTMIFGIESIPSPPTSTVLQPFGVRYATQADAHVGKDAIRNPYEDLYHVVPGRAEQGAFDTR
jgi:hypothetical protein